MPLMLRILLIVSAIWTAYYILRGIRKSQLSIQDSIFWIVFSVVAFLLAVFPNVAIGMTQLLGFVSPANFIFLVFIFILYIKLFSTGQKISVLENKIKKLGYELALKNMEERDGKDQIKGTDAGGELLK